MPMYAVPGSVVTLTTAYKSAAMVYAPTSPTRRGAVRELIFGQGGSTVFYASTDCDVRWDLSPMTVPGTATAWSPTAFNSAEPASQSTAAITATVEPTITASGSRFNMSINQRNSWRWAAVDQDSAIIFAASSGAGFALRAQSMLATCGIIGQINFSE